jgi:two-component sensor histidine kinase
MWSLGTVDDRALARIAEQVGGVTPADLVRELGPGEVEELTAKDGRVFERRTERLGQGGAGRVVGFRDVTEERRAAAARHEAAYRKQLLTELHHRVKNDLQLIAGMLRLGFGWDGDARVEAMLGRIQAIALVHEQLAGRDASDVGTRAFVERLVEAVRRAHAAPAGHRIRLAEAADVPLAHEAFMNLGMILCELVVNAVRHGFAGREGGTIAIALTTDDGLVRLVVEDDGNGKAGPETPWQEGLGMQLVRSLATRLGGDVAIERAPGRGTRVAVTFVPA